MAASLERRYSQCFLSDVNKLDFPFPRRMLEPIETNLLTYPLEQGKKRVGNSAPGRWHFQEARPENVTRGWRRADAAGRGTNRSWFEGSSKTAASS